MEINLHRKFLAQASRCRAIPCEISWRLFWFVASWGEKANVRTCHGPREPQPHPKKKRSAVSGLFFLKPYPTLAQKATGSYNIANKEKTKTCFDNQEDLSVDIHWDQGAFEYGCMVWLLYRGYGITLFSTWFPAFKVMLTNNSKACSCKEFKFMNRSTSYFSVFI